MVWNIGRYVSSSTMADIVVQKENHNCNALNKSPTKLEQTVCVCV